MLGAQNDKRGPWPPRVLFTSTLSAIPPTSYMRA
jgi:hypothetical protein